MSVISRLLFCLAGGVLFLSTVRGEPAPDLTWVVADHADISSPRTTLDSLYNLTETFQALVDTDGITFNNQDRLRNINAQFQKLFDLREIPPKYRRHVAAETAVYLREALARHPLPTISDVPGEDRMVERISEGRVALYQLPGTPAVIRKTDAGVYEGRYQFSAATLMEAKDWYEATVDLPYQEGQETVDGLHEAYFLTPGPLIPHELIRALPGWLQVQWLDQALWQWMLLIVTTLVLAVLILLLHVAVKYLANGRGELRRNLVFLLWPIGVIYLALGARGFLEHHVMLSGEVLQDVLFATKLVMLAATVYLVIRLGNVLTETVLTARQFEVRKIERQLVRLGVRLITIMIAVVIVLEGMQQIGFSLATLVAGAGVTGLAIALAAQDTLKNVFGGLLLAMDRPFEVGQRVRMKGYEGFIQEVGLRSTRMRTLSGHQIIIPNEEAARMEVENIGRRPFIRRDLNITITYDTPPEKIARAVEILHEILDVPEAATAGTTQEATEIREPHPNEAINQPDFPPRVYFNDLNADSLNLLVVYWFHPPELWPSVEFAHRINMQIMQRFNAEGIDFAFPSQTMYLAGDSKRPVSLGERPPDSPSTLAAAMTPHAVSPAADAEVEETVLQGGDDGDGDGTH